jgi:hypothetical protein
MWLLGLMEHLLHPMRWYTTSLRLSMLLLYEKISKLYPLIHSVLVVLVIWNILQWCRKGVQG